MLIFSRPKIEEVSFPHQVRGPGIFTPIDISLNGWGFLKVSYPKVKKSKPFKKFKLFKSEVITLDVPKDELIKISVWNIFGKKTYETSSPGNNTNISKVASPQLPQVVLPKKLIATPKIFIKDFGASILSGMRIHPIRNFSGFLNSSFKILNKSFNSYKTNNSVKIKSTRLVKAKHHSNYQLKINFSHLQISKEEASNIPKGSKNESSR